MVKRKDRNKTIWPRSYSEGPKYRKPVRTSNLFEKSFFLTKKGKVIIAIIILVVLIGVAIGIAFAVEGFTGSNFITETFGCGCGINTIETIETFESSKSSDCGCNSPDNSECDCGKKKGECDCGKNKQNKERYQDIGNSKTKTINELLEGFSCGCSGKRPETQTVDVHLTQ